MTVREVRIGDVCTIKGGYAFKSTDFIKSGIPVVKIANIVDESIVFDEHSNYLPVTYIDKYDDYKVKKGDVLIALSGATTGKYGMYNYDENALLNQRVAKITAVPNYLDTKYLFYYMSQLKDKILYKASGAAQPNISTNEISNFTITLPPIKIQKEITNLLDKAKKLIDKRKAQIEALDQLMQSVFLEMFGDPVTNPNGWEIVNLQDIADYFIGLTYKPNDVSDEGIVVLRSSNIQNGVIDLNDIVRVKKEVNDKLLVKQNDILMCSRNGSARLVGKVALIPELEERMTFGAFMTIIRSRYYCYLYNYFQSSAFRRQITSGATTTINQITKKMLNYVKLPLPPTSLQNEFAHKVEQIQHQKEILQTSLLELENMYNSLMQKAFKGELFTEEKVSNL